MNCVIRPIVPEDRPFLWEMLYQAIHVIPGEGPPLRDVLLIPEIRKYLEGWGQPHDLGFVAVDSRMAEPRGAAWLRLLIGDHQGYGYIDDSTPELTVAVMPDCRGKGIGTQLLRHLLASAELRYASLSLSVSPDNPAQRLYKRLGFETVGTRGSSLVMRYPSRLPLSGQPEGLRLLE